MGPCPEGPPNRMARPLGSTHASQKGLGGRGEERPVGKKAQLKQAQSSFLACPPWPGLPPAVRSCEKVRGAGPFQPQ